MISSGYQPPLAKVATQPLGLFADRTSTATMRANQLRLYFSSVAYMLMQALRRLGLQGTEFARAQCTTIRLKLLKIGAQIHVTVRRIWIRMAGGYPMPTCLLRSTRTSRKSRYVVKRLRSDIPPVSTLVGIAVSVIRFHLAILFNTNHSGSVFQLRWPLCSRDNRSRPLSLLPIARFAIILEKCGLESHHVN